MKKTSYPKQDIRILLLEGISPSAVETFRAAGYSNIVAHAKALPEDKEKALAAGANDYLSKPVDYDVLINMIALWCSRR